MKPPFMKAKAQPVEVNSWASRGDASHESDGTRVMTPLVGVKIRAVGETERSFSLHFLVVELA